MGQIARERREKSVESTSKECVVHSRQKGTRKKRQGRMPPKRETAAVTSIDITTIEFER